MGDLYEDQHIAEPGSVVFRDKKVARGIALAGAGVALWCGFLATVAVLQGVLGASVGFAVLSVLSVYLALTRSVLRTVLTRDALRVHWGMQEVVIPLAAVQGVSLTGVGRAALQRAMEAPGAVPVESMVLSGRQRRVEGAPEDEDYGHAVEVRWRDEARGKDRRAWLGAEDPEGLFRAIEAQRAQVRTGVRVGEGAAAADDAEASATSASTARSAAGNEPHDPA